MASLAVLGRKLERDDTRAQLRELIQERSVLRGNFKLASGGTSEILFDMKRTTQDRVGMHLVAKAISEALRDEPAEYLGGLELGAVPVIIAACMESGRNALMVRKETKGRGTNQLVEGDVRDGAEVIVVDDVTTKGNSVLQAVKALREKGCVVRKVVTVVDRLEGAEDNLRASGCELIALFRRTELV